MRVHRFRGRGGGPPPRGRPGAAPAPRTPRRGGPAPAGPPHPACRRQAGPDWSGPGGGPPPRRRSGCRTRPRIGSGSPAPKPRLDANRKLGKGQKEGEKATQRGTALLITSCDIAPAPPPRPPPWPRGLQRPGRPPRSSPCAARCPRSPSCSTSCATRSCASRPSGCGSRSGPRRRLIGARSPRWTPSFAIPVKRMTTTRPGGPVKADYEIWISDGDLVKTYLSAHGLDPAPGPQPAARPRRSRSPRHVQGLRAGHGTADGNPSRHVHPSGRVLPERARDRALHGHRHGGSSRGREAILLECDHPRTTELAGDRPDFHISIAVDRDTGVILRLVKNRRRRHPRGRGGRALARRATPRRRCSSSSSPPGRRCCTGAQAPDGMAAASARRVEWSRMGQMTSRSRSISRSSSALPLDLGALNQ